MNRSYHDGNALQPLKNATTKLKEKKAANMNDSKNEGELVVGKDIEIFHND